MASGIYLTFSIVQVWIQQGPYGSDINFSKGKWINGQHDLNAMDSTIDEIISESNNNYKLINDIPN